jgi:hypothetical protein
MQTIVFILVLLTNACFAKYNIGDVFAGVGNGKVKRFDQDGNLLQTLSSTVVNSYITGMTFDAIDNLYVTKFDIDVISKFDPTGNLDTQSFMLGDSGSNCESIVMNAKGEFYVGQADGTKDVLHFDNTGTRINAFDVPTEDRGSDWIDLSADQCTLFYSSEGGHIKKYNVCNDTALPDFAPIPTEPAYALRIRSNGDVLIAASQSVHRFAPNGTVIFSYTPTACSNIGCDLFALNLDPDHTSFWTGDIGTGKVWKIDIETGAELKFWDSAPFTSLTGLAVYGELTAAIQKLVLTPIFTNISVDDSVTIQVQLINGLNLDNVPIELFIYGVNGVQNVIIYTDITGIANYTYIGINAGSDITYATTNTTNNILLTSNQGNITWIQTKIKTTIDSNCDTLISECDDTMYVEATLKIGNSNNLLIGSELNFTLDTGAFCVAGVQADGIARCSISLDDVSPSNHSLTIHYAGDDNYTSADMVTYVVVVKEDSMIEIVSSSQFEFNNINIQAKLIDADENQAIDGKVLMFIINNVSMDATTDDCGIASTRFDLGPGLYNITIVFGGDLCYNGTIIYYSFYVYQDTNFVIWGDNLPNLGDIVIGNSYTFWGIDWINQVTSGDYSAIDSFKGWANHVNNVDMIWSTDSNEKYQNPPCISKYIKVIITTSITQKNTVIFGDIVKYALLEVDNSDNYPNTVFGTLINIF